MKNKLVMDDTDLVEVKCKKCGKLFIPAPFHVFKDYRGMYCSWTCFNHRKDKGGVDKK